MNVLITIENYGEIELELYKDIAPINPQFSNIDIPSLATKK